MTRPYLGNPKYTIEVLQKYGFVFQKRFGQNSDRYTRTGQDHWGIRDLKRRFCARDWSRNRYHDPVSC